MRSLIRSRRGGGLLASAERVHEDSKLLDLHLVKLVRPGRHDAVARLGDLGGEGGEIAAIERNLIGQVGGAELLVALALLAVAGHAIVGEYLGAAHGRRLVRLSARELHDELAQTLTALKMDLTWLRESGVAEKPAVAARLAAIAAGVAGLVLSTAPAVAQDISVNFGQGSGLTEPGFARFYRDLAAGLGPGRLRAGLAVLDGDDVGYILGAVRDGRYRGLQLAYAVEVAPLSVGNLLQLGQMERLVAEGGLSVAAHARDLARVGGS